jgi:hypothetical protein
MVRAGDQSVLGRITIVNYLYEVKLDLLVKPALPVTDYLTKFSGLTQ